MLKYVTPEARVIDIHLESVICESGGGSLGNLTPGNDLDED